MKREFDAKLRKVGNSFVVTVPSSIISRFSFQENQFLTSGIITGVERIFDAKLRKVGNSHVLTIPASLVKRFNFKPNQFLTVFIEISENES